MTIKIFCAFCGNMFDADLDNFEYVQKEICARACSQSCYDYLDYFIKGGTTPLIMKEKLNE